MPRQALVSAGIVEPLAKFLASLGVADARAMLPRHQETEHGDPQVPAGKVIALLERLSLQLDKPQFGIEYAHAFPVGGTGAFGYMLAHSKTMRLAVEAIARYTGIVMSSVDVLYEPVEGGGQLSWRYRIGVPSPNTQFNLFVAALVVLRLRALLSPDWSPRQVQLANLKPAAGELCDKTFGRNVSFGQPVNRLTFRDANLDRPNFAADPRLFAVVKQLGDILLAAQKEDVDFRTTVANEIVRLLGTSHPTLKAVGEELGLGARSVQRRLAAEGTSFEGVLAQTRRAVAERLLCDTDLPLTDIAFMLGFSELSAFTRAGKRWHGVSPRQFRDARRR